MAAMSTAARTTVSLLSDAVSSHPAGAARPRSQDAHQIAAERQTERHDPEHVATGRGDPPDCRREQSEAFVDIEQHIAGDRRCGARSRRRAAATHIVAVPIEQSLLGVAEQPMERTGLDDFVLERRSLVVHRADCPLQQFR